jgi:hypothetical protein
LSRSIFNPNCCASRCPLLAKPVVDAGPELVPDIAGMPHMNAKLNPFHAPLSFALDSIPHSNNP